MRQKEIIRKKERTEISAIIGKLSEKGRRKEIYKESGSRQSDGP